MSLTKTDKSISQKVFPDHPTPGTHLLTYLDIPNPKLSIGFTTEIPPTPRSFTENHHFVSVLNEVLVEHAHKDPDFKSQAYAFAGPGGSTFSSPSVVSRKAEPNDGKSAGKMTGGGGAGGASAQGGAGGGGRGGHVHLSDSRNPPDFGRIAWPEDIFGSAEVDRRGQIVGRLQPSGTYRIVTNEGV